MIRVSSSNKITIDEMKQYMSEMAAMAKEKGAVPVLISPVYNSKYQHKTYFTYSTSTKINAITEFAESIGVECIDLNKYTQLYVKIKPKQIQMIQIGRLIIIR